MKMIGNVSSGSLNACGALIKVADSAGSTAPKNKNPISPTTKPTSGIIQVITKACQLPSKLPVYFNEGTSCPPKKPLDKQCRPISKQSDQGLTCLTILTSNLSIPALITNILIENRMRKVFEVWNIYHTLSYDVASGSEITPCNKIDKPLVVYRFMGNFMKSINNVAYITKV